MPRCNPMRDDAEEAACLLTPLGRAGSGRVRYGAAMHFFNRGLLSREALEVYRALANDDRDDPVLRLRDIGRAEEVHALTAGAGPAKAALAALLTEAGRVIADLPPHGGSGAVADGLARLKDAPFRWQAARACPLPAELDQALALVPPAFAASVRHAQQHLRWITYDAYPASRIGAKFARSHTYASLAGGEGGFEAQDFDLGLFLIAPRTLYRDHAHPAPELYAPLTGPHEWRFQPGAAFTAKPAGEPVWNPPLRPHATLTGDVPFLGLYVWTAAVNEPAYVMDAPDWAEIEEKLV